MYRAWFLVFLSIALVNGKTIYVTPPEEYIPGILEASVKCAESAGLQSDFLKKFLTWQFEDSDASRKYLYCLGTTLGYADENGYGVADTLVKLADNQYEDKVRSVLGECNKLKWSDKYEAVYQNAVCFHDKSSIEFRL